MKKRVLFVAVAFVLAGSLACAETTYTVASAVESALRNNISVERSRLGLDALRRKADISWNGILPSLTASAGASRNFVDPYVADPATSAYGTVSASVSVSSKLFTAVEAARLAYEAGLISHETAVRDTELAVRKAFFNILYQQKNVALLGGNLATAQKQYEQVLANQKAGLVSDLEVMSAQVNLENIRPNLMSAQGTLLNAFASFRQMIGDDSAEEIALEGSLDDAMPRTAIDVSAVSVRSADIAALEKALESARLAERAALASVWSPALSLSVSGRTSASDLAEGTWVQTGTATAAVSLPLDGVLPWSSTNAVLDSARESVKDIELQISSAETSSALTVQTLLRRIAQSGATIKARELNVQLAQKSYGLTENAWKRGAKDLLALQDAADSLQEAELLRMQESYTLVCAVLDLEYELGVPFGTLGR